MSHHICILVALRLDTDLNHNAMPRLSWVLLKTKVSRFPIAHYLKVAASLLLYCRGVAIDAVNHLEAGLML